MKNIVIIGGGTGTFTLLSGLRKFPTNNSVIVSTADDGGSTGRLREELGVIPPGDIRQCLVGLSYTDETLRNLFNYRFEKGSLQGHSLGNIIIAGLEKSTGSIEKAIIEVAKLLNVRGQVVPVTLYPTVLTAVYYNGKKVIGEHNIDEVHPTLTLPLKRREIKKEKFLPLEGGGEVGVGLSIRSLALKPSAPANSRALRLIKQADAIVFGPGDLYTSTMPHLLVKGVSAGIKKSKARKILVTNIMTKWGQTNGFKASDFVRELEKYLKGKLDMVLVNTQKPGGRAIAHYKKEKAGFVEPDVVNLKKLKVQVIAKPLLGSNTFVKNNADALTRSFLRHDSDKLARIIYDIVT